MQSIVLYQELGVGGISFVDLLPLHGKSPSSPKWGGPGGKLRCFDMRIMMVYICEMYTLLCLLYHCQLHIGKFIQE